MKSGIYNCLAGTDFMGTQVCGIDALVLTVGLTVYFFWPLFLIGLCGIIASIITLHTPDPSVRAFLKNIAITCAVILVIAFARQATGRIYDKIRESQRSAASSGSYAAKAVEDTLADSAWSSDDSEKLVRGVECYFSTYDFIGDLPAGKQKEIVEIAAADIVRGRYREPYFTEYAWQTYYLDGKPWYVAMCLFYPDGTYTDLYSINIDDWENIAEKVPSKLTAKKYRKEK